MDGRPVSRLDPDAGGTGEGITGPFVVTGRDEVTRRAMLFIGPDSSTTLLFAPGNDGGVMAVRDGRVFALLTLEIRGGRIIDIHAIADSDKLASLNETIGSNRSR